MKTVVYDSWYGNTAKIAEVIGRKLGEDTQVLRAEDATAYDLSDLEILIVGSPTHGGMPTPAIQNFLERVGSRSLGGVKVAAFDTRVPARWVKLIGFASSRIIRQLRAKGGTPIGPNVGFYVHGKQGPLVGTERARAEAWAKQILQNAQLESRKEQYA